ncbi:hypothetical protein [Acetivibrio clariflavus]|uniref:Transmembrane protein n=1 Tax=Acetivibrio clariflavus (strain DSM 19732 / NBRC 101661 / EBR45) TaxID=720554 RepID=G8LXQ0_ACECE|nr:hypothetical protein [Acetivibrio clariflavus]AEV67761.1 hypothetical protein Clocl_1086 [Acetivibrio clariflavus DSM 19732]
MLRDRLFKLETIAVIIVAVFLVGILMIKPIIGVADNGDFERIMITTGLEYKTSDYNEKYFNYVNREYLSTSPFVNGIRYFSSTLIFVLAAKFINSIVLFNKGIFDIRFLAVLYCCMLLLFIYLMAKHDKKSVPIVNFIYIILTVLIFTDAGYISYFNSLYGEALAFTSLLLVIAMAVYLSRSQNPRVLALIAFYVAAIFLTCAKFQYIPIGIVIAMFSLLFLRLRKDKKWRIAISTCIAAILAISVAAYVSIPDVFRVCNKYQSVFYGVLKDSDTPEADLEKLGLNKEYAMLAGTHYFMGKYPIDIKEQGFREEINSKVSPFKVAMFYLRHPIRYIQKLEITANKAFKLILGFGNYEKSHDPTPKKEVSNFRVWSDFKDNVLPHSLWFLFLFFAAYTAILIFQYRKADGASEKLYFATFLLVMIIGIIQFIIPVICDGEADLSKHLFLFNVCFDIMFIYMVVWLTEYVFVSLKRKNLNKA